MLNRLRHFFDRLFFYLGFYYKRTYSLSGEDMIVQRILEKAGISRGFYVDVGAFNPSRFNNTKRLYNRGWKGMNIEPCNIIPFKMWRADDINLKCAVSDKSGIKVLTMDFKDSPHSSFVKKFESSIEVEVKTLAQLLEEYNIKHIDVLDIDAEGEDYNVLLGHNWDIKPKIILIEVWGDSVEEQMKSPIYEYLKELNYKLRSVAIDTLIFELKE